MTRSTFVEEQTSTAVLPDVRLIGELPRGFPTVGGYNLTYLRKDATLGVRTRDEYKAPVLAFWHRGIGRVAAVTAEVDGKWTGPLRRWQRYGEFFSTIGRWIGEGPIEEKARVTARLDGQDAVVRVELDPERARTRDPGKLTARLLGPRDTGEPARKTMTWEDQDTLTVRFRLSQPGPHVGLVRMGPNRLLRTPPIELPYSAEFAPGSFVGRGKATLRRLAELTGGRERINLEGIFEPLGKRVGWRPLKQVMLWLILGVLLLEIAGRRLGLWAEIRLDRLKRLVRPLERLSAPLRRLRRRRRRPKKPEELPPAPEPAEAPPPEEEKAPEPGPPLPEQPAPGLGSLQKAKRKARERYRS